MSDSQNDAAIDHVSFSVSASKRAKAVEEASTQALQSFRERAQNVSHVLGFSGYKIVKMELNQSFENEESSSSEMPLMFSRTSYVAAPAAISSEKSMDTSAGKSRVYQRIRATVQMQ